MKIVCAFGEHNYGNPGRGLSYEYANFLPALKGLGHEVIHFESWNRCRYSDFASLNEAFLQTIEAEQPDVVFCVLMHYELWQETFEEIKRRCRSVLIHWGTDDSWKYEQFARWVAPWFNVYATTSAVALTKARRDGLSNFFLTQWAANSVNLTEPLPANQCQYPVSFIGSAYGNRPNWVAELKKRGIEVNCFGYGWEKGPVRSEEIPRIIRNSAISLNFGDSGLVLKGLRVQRSRQIKARVFEVPGAGGFLLTEDAPRLDEFYVPGKEVVVFSSAANLADKIRYYLERPGERDAIARAGFERTRLEHTYEQRFRALLGTAAQQLSSTRSVPPVKDCCFDQQWFARLRSQHMSGRMAQLLRSALVFGCSAIWGRERGPRAARRLVFEASWRALRGRTYSAAGLPGRLFYTES
jgi:spore maturation protein CgeB